MDRIALYIPPFEGIGSYMEMVDIAAAYGIKHLETIHMFELSEPNLDFARKLRAYADEKGVDFPCVSLGIDLVGDDTAWAIARTKEYAKVAQILGAPYLHHTIACEYQNPARIAENKDTFYQQGLKAVREIYDFAQTLGVRTIYEDQGYLFNGVQGFENFLRDVDRDVGVVADFGNILFVDEYVQDFIPKFADRIVNAHVKDYRITQNPQREKEEAEYITAGGNFLLETEFGKGDINFDTAFAALGAIGYTGTVALECPALDGENKQGFERNLAFLKKYI